METGVKVRLQPNKEQAELFKKFCGTSRFAWNESKSFYDKLWEERKEYASIQQMIEHLQELKRTEKYTWLNDVPEAITKQAIKDLHKAYQRFYQERKKPHKKSKHNKKSDYDYYKPNYKRKGKSDEKFYQRTDKIYKTDDTHIKITGIKKPIKCTSLRGVDLPKKIHNPRIRFDGKYWYLSYSYEIKSDNIVDFEREKIGVDLGIKDLAVFSNGNHYENINKSSEIKRLKKRLHHIQRQISRKYEANITVVKGKKVYHKTNNIKKLEQIEKLIYRRISNIQRTYMYEVVNALVRTKPKQIILEDLNVKGMLQNPKLARSIQEERLSEFRRIVAYKCEQNGINLVLADKWFPSSQLCSCCGYRYKDMTLKIRRWKCPNCGEEHDRDLNASINLENYIELKEIV